MSRRTKHEKNKGSDVSAYSLWTAPPTTWASPIEPRLLAVDLKTSVEDLGLARAEEDEQTKAFKTPVTPEVLSQPTEG